MSYDVLAPIYRFLETLSFGRALQQARCACLEHKQEPPRNVLVLGDGDGRFLQAALKAWPESRFVSVDQSKGMLRLAKSRTSSKRVRFIQADILEDTSLLKTETYDLVVTHFFLDCFHERSLAVWIPRILTQLSPQGLWIVSDFGSGRRWQRGILWIMYRFFHTLTETEARRMPDYRAILSKAGLQSTPLGSWRRGLVFSESWNFNS